MITFERLKQKGYIIEVNTTGAMIVDTIDADDIPLTSLQEANYTQKISSTMIVNKLMIWQTYQQMISYIQLMILMI